MYLLAREQVSYSPFVPTAVTQAQTLAKYGYNGAEAQKLQGISSTEARDRYLRRNLETTINHVFEDSVVSFTNSYQMLNGEVVSLPDRTALHIDPDERGGLYKFGIESAVGGAIDNPNQVVLLYSPPGPVVFDDNPKNKFKEVKPYTQGQLYIMYFDGEKVNNVAVSISPDGESWVQEVMPHVYNSAKKRTNEIEQVSSFIQQSFLTGLSIDRFLEKSDSLNDRVVFRNKDGIDFSLSQTLSLIRQSLAGTLPRSSVVEQIMKQVNIQKITTSDIDIIYGALAHHYMKEKGLKSLILGGSCGGEEVKFNIFSNGLANLSTSFRMIVQGNGILKPSVDFRDDPNLCRCSAATGPHFHCPGKDISSKEPCNHAIVVGDNIDRCKKCGTGKTC